MCEMDAIFPQEMDASDSYNVELKQINQLEIRHEVITVDRHDE